MSDYIAHLAEWHARDNNAVQPEDQLLDLAKQMVKQFLDLTPVVIIQIPKVGKNGTRSTTTQALNASDTLDMNAKLKWLKQNPVISLLCHCYNVFGRVWSVAHIRTHAMLIMHISCHAYAHIHTTFGGVGVGGKQRWRWQQLRRQLRRLRP